MNHFVSDSMLSKALYLSSDIAGVTKEWMQAIRFLALGIWYAPFFLLMMAKCKIEVSLYPISYILYPISALYILRSSPIPEIALDFCRV